MNSTFYNLTSCIADWFWSEKFWLPPNVTWADLERDDTTFLPKPTDMFIPFPIGVILLLLRYLFERFIAHPVGKWYKIKENPPKIAKPNALLESAYKKFRRLPGKDEVLELSKKLDMTVRQIERWWRLRKLQGKPSEMRKFKETSWRFFFYLSIFTYGVVILWSKPWFWDTLHCWYNYPRQHISNDVWWYYMIELGFYWSLVFSLCFDNKRKDFKEMIIHHFATIALMVFSWVDNMVRVGTLVLAVHDAVDYWMEGAKLAKYLGYAKLCDILFVAFAVVWVITRLIIFPFRVIHTTMFEGHTIIGMLPAYYVFNVLLCLLQALHIFWFYIIGQMFHQYIVKGRVEKDGRSDTEDDSDEENDRETETKSSETNGHINGKFLTSNNNISVNPVVHSRSD